MKKYKVTYTHTRNNKIEKEYDEIIETPVHPKIGDGWTLCCYPPIYIQITKIEEVE